VASAVPVIPFAIMRESLGLAVPTVSRVSFILYSTWRTEYSLGSFCGPTVKSFPVCADPSLVLYKGRYGELFLLPVRLTDLSRNGGVGLYAASDT
jgi:hypothetical protein